MKIKTNSLKPGEPKDPNDSALFEIYRAFANESETEALRARFAEGIAWGEMKQLLFEYLDEHLQGPRTEYRRLLAAPDHVETLLKRGAERARAVSRPFLDDIRARVGIRPLSGSA
jgi:tryptophanyl-tRNA synthetase